MAWHVVYETVSGIARVVCETADLPSNAELTAKGLSVFNAADGVDPRRLVWRAATRDFAPPVPDPVYVDPSEMITAFAHGEWGTIRSHANTRIQHFYDQVMARRSPVNVMTPKFAALFDLLVALNVLTRARADAILADLRSGAYS